MHTKILMFYFKSLFSMYPNEGKSQRKRSNLFRVNKIIVYENNISIHPNMSMDITGNPQTTWLVFAKVI